ncbi:MAG: S-methyl-5'-thioadenosine phosphorylase [Desulfobacula sp.]|jgi:5'-methylthioadenosine phosphorylase|uniref:S-methyl-5'-thioadenosine phosphorylase n=1 Tax=Desulfobacula sp. TaxID=2593537 RepID=UPI001D9D95E8|nr:S-methyl-5'-thioadenosine phosphorylase [Desulfobacula sp.]MBT3484756.1 S-methyl-5'-thioadenosine phosphorylase [Desulfobacula sp.]MBT3804386.1 S-methyl-5'-thioadenosine phosphorylase [Desulfobacula sp.]MBT4025177.1 S-methyl-5'-thioadenosine phosphorylase [Desulfobacula sp.]MBT4198579.1 S-methyl-5'-thioadenosine phosphorylase [Desulfobacula sp.]
MLKIGIIGGSGLDDPDILKNSNELEIKTEYGNPSSPLLSGKINDVEILILARHGRKHQLSPTQVNNRANIKALQQEGVTHIIATTACGSLRDEIDRGHLVILDQFIDFTRFRKNTFADSFKNGLVHPVMSHPFDDNLRKTLCETAKQLDLRVHDKGCVVTIEGPRFSTVAESKMFRQWGADVINMSTAPEAMLANEVAIPYAAVAMSTDYDSWKEDEAPVTWDEILAVFDQNSHNVIKLLVNVIEELKE